MLAHLYALGLTPGDVLLICAGAVVWLAWNGEN